MSAVRITDAIHWAGALLPALRTADVVVDLPYGTSLNAYIVRGDRKTALIDTTLIDTVDQCRDNLRELPDLTVDCIILNHTEPDHSGSLLRLVERFPGAQVMATPTAARYLKKILNRPLDIHQTRDGEELDLGGRTLRFLHTPFLHWADTQMTWCPEERALFPCDFLAAHFCEPRILSDRIQFNLEYEACLELFYRAVMAPFAEHVQAGLHRIRDLDLRYVCPSHGPVLVGDAIGRALARYRAWSTPDLHRDPVVGVFYTSAYRCTAALGDQIAQGIRATLGGGHVTVYDLNDTRYDWKVYQDLLAESDALLVGSPTINRDATAPLWRLLAGVDALNTRGKLATAFGSFGWSGEAVPMLLERLRSLKFEVQDEGFRVCFVPDRDELKAAYEFGKAFGLRLAERWRRVTVPVA
nr:FprA family A-type flavoprotein [uncultured Holophaga sp.]